MLKVLIAEATSENFGLACKNCAAIPEYVLLTQSIEVDKCLDEYS